MLLVLNLREKNDLFLFEKQNTYFYYSLNFKVTVETSDCQSLRGFLKYTLVLFSSKCRNSLKVLVILRVFFFFLLWMPECSCLTDWANFSATFFFFN